MRKATGNYSPPPWESKEATDRRRERERRRDELLELLAEPLGELIAKIVDARLSVAGGRQNGK
jgi:hypothetical protein